MLYETWAGVAETRVRRILLRERVMSQHMLESKISESGPVDASPGGNSGEPGKANQRAEPPHVSAAVRALVRAGDVIRLPAAEAKARGLTATTPLYLDGSFNLASPSTADEARLARVIAGYEAWDSANSKTPLCGAVLEHTVHAAALAAGTVTVVGDPSHDPHIPVNATELPSSPADHVLAVGGDLILVEDKNRRSWLYPRRPEVWTLLGRCLETDRALPILVTRKVPPALLTFFQEIGALAFQTNNQLFAASVAPAVNPPFRLVVEKSGLNFHDIRFAESAAALALRERLTKFFVHTVPTAIAGRRKRFREVAPILDYYVGAADNKHGLPLDAYQECLDALRDGSIPEHPMFDDPDDDAF